MSENEKSALIKLTGKVAEGRFSKGSKSDHTAMYFQTEKGSFLLRRTGANPFEDPILKALSGKTITATGRLHNKVFLASEVNVVAEGE